MNKKLKHPKNKLDRLKASDKHEKKKLSAEEKADKVRRKLYREFTKEQEAEDELRGTYNRNVDQ